MQITIDEVTIAEIDEALSHFRNKLQDRYGNRLSYHQRELYLEIVNDLLDARLSLTEGNREISTNSATST
jgi:hypothetical protein